jgi:hypothetical protein
MIKLEKTDVFGWESAIRGMRNPMNSWDKSDSKWNYAFETTYDIGENDLKLMKSLAKAGSDHAKFLRMISVTVDITAPLYWWKEFDTYKVGTVANSCSTMHKIHAKEFELDDFSHEHLTDGSINLLKDIICSLNDYRMLYHRCEAYGKNSVNRDKKDYWWQMIQLLPSSYNQKRTVQLNYQVLKSMYFARKNHKLDEWREFCAWVETLLYFKEICIDV